jgi:hypothetical protein
MWIGSSQADDHLRAVAFRVHLLEENVSRLQRREAQRDPAFAETLRNTCISNLKQVESAKEQWAIVNKKGAVDAPTPADLVGTATSGYLKTMPRCPMGGEYSIGNMAKRPTCTLEELGHVLP